jgi:hypothetical protein
MVFAPIDPILRGCGTRNPTSLEAERCLQRRDRARDLRAGAGARAIARTKLHVRIVYHVLHSSTHEFSNVSLERIREQHRVLNRDYNLRNEDSGKVPITGAYAFAEDRGSADLIFDPEDHAVLTEGDQIRRVAANRTFGGLLNILDSGVSPPVAGSMNCYIAALTPATLAGQAELESNRFVVTYLTVGGDRVPGAGSPRYNQGRSVVHEVGHCLGLNHPFAQGCVGERLVSDVPTTKLPNYQAELWYNADLPGWDGFLDNANRDARLAAVVAPETSPVELMCQSKPYACEPGQAEMFMNFMDYSDDSVAVMFSQGQADEMHMFVRDALETPNGVFDVREGEAREETPPLPLPAPPDATGTPPADPEVAWDINSCSGAGSLSSVPWWVWLIIGLIFAMSLGFAIYRQIKGRKQLQTTRQQLVQTGLPVVFV